MEKLRQEENVKNRFHPVESSKEEMIRMCQHAIYSNTSYVYLKTQYARYFKDSKKVGNMKDN